MSDRYGSYPPDEPVIGANYPPEPSPSGYDPQSEYIGGGSAWPQQGRAVTPTRDPDETYSEDYDEYGDGYDEEYEDDYGYYDENPARQPMFYVFIALAVLIGGGLIFLLFALFTNGDDDPSVSAGFNVSIDAPLNNERVQINRPTDFAVRATSNEQISQFELFVEDRSVDLVTVSAPGAGDVYSAVLKHTFDRTGEYSVHVRVTSVSGATKDSDEINVIAIQSVGDKPVEIKGRAAGTASIREGPGESFAVVRTLNAGEEVTIIGKTRDSSWLLLKDDDGWVRREAIEELDSLSLIPIKDPTPTPPPPTVETATPSVTASPTTDPNAPDFVPANAILIDGGSTLRVTVQNLASGPYEGPLVVGVSRVDVVSAQVVVDVDIPASGSVTVDFELEDAITDSGSTAQITVDPGNAVDESNEDNNIATFLLTPALESPNLIVLAPTYDGDTMAVTIRNDGGELKTSTLLVRVESGGGAVEQSSTVALAKGQSANFSFSKPSAGAAKIRVLVNGVQVSAADVEVP